MKTIVLTFLFLFVHYSSAQQQFSLVKEVGPLLKSKSWIDQCFGVLRLEKYSKDPLSEKVILNLIKSRATPWQVKVFAVRAAGRFGITVPDNVFQNLKNPFIAKAALLNGLEINPRYLENCIAANIRSRDSNTLMTTIELCILANTEKSLKTAKTKMRSLMKTMKPSESIIYGDRLCRILEQEFSERFHWKKVSKEDFSLINNEDFKEKLLPVTQDLFKSKNEEEFNTFINYYEGFQETDLDIAVAMDGTGSMYKGILEVKLQTRNLMQTLGALSKSLQLSIIIYRDIHSPKNGDPQVAKFTYDFKDLMEFLGPVVATGGNNDTPESILSGIQEVQNLKWRNKSSKHLIILGDAPSHEEDMSKLEESLYVMRKKQKVITHTIAYITPFSGEETKKNFKTISKFGGGQYVELDPGENNFSKTILKYSMEPKVFELFDEFYKVFTVYCL